MLWVLLGEEKITKLKLRKWIRVSLIIVIIILATYITYSMGIIRGVFLGSSAILEQNDNTLCEYMVTLDDSPFIVGADGVCETKEPYLYDTNVECNHISFRIRQKEEAGFFSRLKTRIVFLGTYPALGCKVV